MNHKHQRTLDDIHKEPASGNIHWREVDALLKAIGAELLVSHGARMTFKLNGVEGTVHRPHHSSALTKQDVRHLRQFLSSAGY